MPLSVCVLDLSHATRPPTSSLVWEGGVPVLKLALLVDPEGIGVLIEVGPVLIVELPELPRSVLPFSLFLVGPGSVADTPPEEEDAAPDEAPKDCAYLCSSVSSHVYPRFARLSVVTVFACPINSASNNVARARSRRSRFNPHPPTFRIKVLRSIVPARSMISRTFVTSADCGVVAAISTTPPMSNVRSVQASMASLM